MSFTKKPSYDLDVDGVSQSILQRWLVCPERTRLYLFEGLEEKQKTSYKTHYGSAIHEGLDLLLQGESDVKATAVCVETFKSLSTQEELDSWLAILKEHFKLICRDRHKLFGFDNFQSSKSQKRSKDKQSPVTIESRVPEQKFKVAYEFPYTDKQWQTWLLPTLLQHPGSLQAREVHRSSEHNQNSGVDIILSPQALNLLKQLTLNSILLRGKIDITEFCMIAPRHQKPYSAFSIIDHKVVGDVSPATYLDRIRYDFQMLTYALVSTNLYPERTPHTIKLNVIRRPLSEQYSIRKRKQETSLQFAKRAAETTWNSDSGYLKCSHKITDLLSTAAKKTLIPILRDFKLWYYNLKFAPKSSSPEDFPGHFTHPFGVYNPYHVNHRGGYFDAIVHDRGRDLVSVKSYFEELE